MTAALELEAYWDRLHVRADAYAGVPAANALISELSHALKEARELNHRTHGEASEVELLEGIIADLIREKDDPRHAESPNLRMGLSVAILKIHAALSDRSKQEE